MDGDSTQKQTAFPSIAADVCLRFIEQEVPHHQNTMHSGINSVQLLIHVQLFVIPWTAAHQASLFITNSWSLLKLMSVELVMPANCLILYHPLLLLPSIFPNNRVFSNESVLCTRWPQYWSFSFSISPFNEHSGLISLRIDWFDLLAVQATLNSFLQHHSSKIHSLGQQMILSRWFVPSPKARVLLDKAEMRKDIGQVSGCICPRTKVKKLTVIT